MLNYVSERFLLSLTDKNGEIKRAIVVPQMPEEQERQNGKAHNQYINMEYKVKIGNHGCFSVTNDKSYYSENVFVFCHCIGKDSMVIGII